MFDERNLKRDVAALVLLGLTIFVGVSLATYNPADPPGTSVYPSSTGTTNACGQLGAWAAHWLLATLGLGAYFVVLSAAVLDLVLLGRKPLEEPLLRAIGWTVALVALCLLAAMAMQPLAPGPVIGAGGYVGAAARGFVSAHFATAGAYILTGSLLLAGLLLCTDYVILRISLWVLGGSALGIVRATQALPRRPTAATSAKAKATGAATEDDADGLAIRHPRRGKSGAAALAGGKPVAGNQSDLDDHRLRGEQSLHDDDDEIDEEGVDDEEDEAAAAATMAKIASRGKSSGGKSSGGKSAVEKSTAGKSTIGAVVAAVAGAVAGEPPSDERALKIRPPVKKKGERDPVHQELDAATLPDDAQNYELPSIDLLLEQDDFPFDAHEAEVRKTAKVLERTFASFGFNVRVVEIQTGPVIAQYEIELERGLRLAKITGLADDIAIALRVPSVRIVAPIPGKNTVGIEVPNSERQIVRLREIIEESTAKAAKHKIPIFLGKDVSGNPMVIDLASLPHLLIAGRTGTGKSVCLNSIIISMLMSRRPDEVRMLMIDPKMVELSPYQRLPHLMHPVVTDMRKAEAILGWAVEKMEERYALLARAGVRHISNYNQLGEEELMERLQPETDDDRAAIPRHLPYIVIVADEMADLMMTCGKEVEQHIIRLAQKSRAVGIHLILATQKPTVDVITGLIKSNLPARISFQVASRVDSRVVLDEMGAEKLLGNGDMLFLWPGTSALLRGQGTYVSDDEITKVVRAVGNYAPQFVKELVQLKPKDQAGAGPGKLPKRDDLYEAAVDHVVREGRGSVSLLQRALGIGYGRAARLIDYMAEDNIVGQYNGSQAREVLLTLADWEAMQAASAEPPPPPARSPGPGAGAKRKPSRPQPITFREDDELDEAEELADEELEDDDEVAADEDEDEDVEEGDEFDDEDAAEDDDDAPFDVAEPDEFPYDTEEVLAAEEEGDEDEVEEAAPAASIPRRRRERHRARE